MRCPECGAHCRPGGRFCTTCGARLEPRICPNCHAENRPVARFCVACGYELSLVAGSPSTASAGCAAAGTKTQSSNGSAGAADWWRTTGQPWLMATLTRANNDRTGLLAAVVVFVTALLVTLIGWFPLSLPARLLNRIFAVVVPGSCPGGYGSFLFGMCAATLGLLTMLGSVVVLALVFVFRGAISRAVRRVSTRLPSEARFLVTPVLATLTFTLAWAGNTFHFFSRPGIVVDGLFPAVVGLLTYVIYRYGPGWQRRLASLMDRRDNLSTWVRVGITAVVAWLFSMLVSSAYPAPVRDQVVVIVGMIIAYLLLAPRQAGMATMSPAGRRTEEGAP